MSEGVSMCFKFFLFKVLFLLSLFCVEFMFEKRTKVFFLNLTQNKEEKSWKNGLNKLEKLFGSLGSHLAI